MKTERSRWLWVALCVAGAALMLLCGWLAPIHLRAVDLALLQRAGRNSPSLVDRALALAQENRTDAARLLLQAAQAAKISDTRRLEAAIGGHPHSDPLFPGGPELSASAPEPVTALVVRLENRGRLLSYLEQTGSPAVLELLRSRDLTNTTFFAPSSSPAGQAFDAAVSLCGLLLAQNRLAPGLREAVVERAASARTRASAQSLEEILMDVMSLGQRLDWGQLAAFVQDINDPETLNLLAGRARNAGAQLPALFAAVVLSQKPDRVATYLENFSLTGLNDLAAALRYGQGGLNEMMRRNQRLYASPRRQQWTASGPLALFFRGVSDYALRVPWFALTLKWFFYMMGGFLLAAALHWARPRVAEIEKPLQVRGFHLARELLFALGFLLVVLLLSEPFLAQESQRTEFPFRLRLSLPGAVATSTTPGAKPIVMNPINLFTLLLFFVLQALLYCACLVKLAEIRRQKVPARVQLKLLENEEHLFDGGLYLGFAGTIVCLILVSLNIIQGSLMAAYSSTSFGVIFVFIFKIFNLRPVRRQLLLQAEAQAAAPEPAASATPSLATSA
jgi:hypothetical protein